MIIYSGDKLKNIKWTNSAQLKLLLSQNSISAAKNKLQVGVPNPPQCQKSKQAGFRNIFGSNHIYVDLYYQNNCYPHSKVVGKQML